MKPLLILIAIVAAVFVISNLSEDSPKKPAVCPECPGGVCPVDRAGSLTSTIPSQEKIVQPIQVMPVPVFTLAKHEKSVVTPAPEIKKGPRGWRLRLLYNAGDKQAEKLVRWFHNRMPVISKKYGFTAIPSDDKLFEVWKDAGYQVKEPVLVLAAPDDTVVIRTTDIPTDIEELRALIRTSAEKFATVK